MDGGSGRDQRVAAYAATQVALLTALVPAVHRPDARIEASSSGYMSLFRKRERGTDRPRLTRRVVALAKRGLAAKLPEPVAGLGDDAVAVELLDHLAQPIGHLLGLAERHHVERDRHDLFG